MNLLHVQQGQQIQNLPGGLCRARTKRCKILFESLDPRPLLFVPLTVVTSPNLGYFTGILQFVNGIIVGILVLDPKVSQDPIDRVTQVLRVNAPEFIDDVDTFFGFLSDVLNGTFNVASTVART